MCLELIKNNQNNIAYKMSAFKQQISTCSFFAQNSMALDVWMDGWMDGWMDEWVVKPCKDCLQQSKISYVAQIEKIIL